MAKGGGKAKFQQDTTVYARNDGLMYKAKILKVSERIVRYLIGPLSLVSCTLL
jgi:hypothetical protein